MNRDEAEYLGRLQRLGCIACRKLYGHMKQYEPDLTDIVIHHVRAGQGGAQRAQNWLTVPLCVFHHVGKGGVHSNGNTIPLLKADEMDLLAWTLELYFKTYGM